MRGINAAVVGLLGAALYGLVSGGGIRDWRDAALAVAGFVLLAVWRIPPLAIVAATVAGSIALARL